ncbi:MAG TPA: hypothetical protein VN812_19485 [Candidatus Acidoferrales bacterium]|nr:hypothetical protein [Candidatus Acidoferrales bacterium]
MPSIVVALLVGTAPTADAGFNVWTTSGPQDQFVAALGINPLTPATLYAGTRGCVGGQGGDVFKSTDGAKSWVALGLNRRVPALAIDPQTPTTVYVATCSEGVFKSVDGGGTWKPANVGLQPPLDEPFPDLNALAIDHTTPNTVYLGTNGVEKSTDAGGSWNPVNAGLTTDLYCTFTYCPPVDVLAVDPTAPSTLYAMTGGLFKSTDGGSTWNGTGLTGVAVGTLAIDPMHPSTLYAGTDSGFLKSMDGGNTWSGTGLTAISVDALAIDPGDPDTLYSGLFETSYGGENPSVLKSTDGGNTWSALNTGLPPNTAVSALVIDATTPATLYAATTGNGVFAIQQGAVCVGDCGGTHTVAVNDIITLVNIALGVLQPVACANGGLPIGGDVDITVIVQAVNNALKGCAG